MSNYTSTMATKANTSIKHRKFVAEPMMERLAIDLPGIGPVLGKRLEVAGYEKASKVFGHFLVLNKDEKRFKEWLKDTCKASSKQSADCYQCLKDYSERFL